MLMMAMVKVGMEVVMMVLVEVVVTAVKHSISSQSFSNYLLRIFQICMGYSCELNTSCFLRAYTLMEKAKQ